VNEEITLRFKKLRPGAVIPTRGSALSAGYDLYACLEESVTIAPGETKGIGTGLSMALPEGWFAGIFARSGLAVKQGLRPANCVGVCDADYRGEYIVALHNDSEEPRTVEPGERIAQMILLPCQRLDFTVVEELSATDRGAAGFGSTGR
jgi:dUTP pyrophosphatase